jgi:Dimerisation domain
MSEVQKPAVERAAEVTPDAILQLGFGFWGSKTLLSAVELGVFSELAAAGALDGEARRECLGLHPRSATDFFDALVALGMLEREEGRYANTPATEIFLDRAKPSYLGGILEMANARLYRFWASLTEGLPTGAPQNEGGRELLRGALRRPGPARGVRTRDERDQRRRCAADRGQVSWAELPERDRYRLRRGRRPGSDRPDAQAHHWWRLRPTRGDDRGGRLALDRAEALEISSS